MIKVVGVGGAGLNAVNRMIDAGISQVEFIAVNTDMQQLRTSDAPVKIHIGRELTQGLGSGADPDVGRRAADEAYDELKQELRGADMVFVAAGEGGGTGSGAAPIVARIAREIGALTVGIVTTPFKLRGHEAAQPGGAGDRRPPRACDTTIVIPNDRLLEVLERSTSMLDAFKVADDVLRQGVQGICDLITMPGLINLDFADVRTIMSDSDTALMGIGFSSSTGDGRAKEAAERALRSPLIDAEITGARGILLSIAGGDDLTLVEVNDAAEVIRAAATDDTNIIFGATVDDRLNGQVWVTVVATGFGGRGRRPRGDFWTPPTEQRRPPGSTGEGAATSTCRSSSRPDGRAGGGSRTSPSPRSATSARTPTRRSRPRFGSGSSTRAASRAARGTGSSGSSWSSPAQAQERLAEAVYAPENVASAALVVAIVGDAGAFDTGRCAQNMMLGAWGDGVVSCPNGIRDADAAAEICGGEVRAIVSFGYPARPRDHRGPQRGGVVGAGEPQAALRARPRGRLAAAGPAGRRRVRRTRRTGCSRRRRTRFAPSPHASVRSRSIPPRRAREAARRRVPVRRPADSEVIRPALRDADAGGATRGARAPRAGPAR